MAVVPHLGAPTTKKSRFLVTTKSPRPYRRKALLNSINSQKQLMALLLRSWQKPCQGRPGGESRHLLRNYRARCASDVFNLHDSRTELGTYPQNDRGYFPNLIRGGCGSGRGNIGKTKLTPAEKFIPSIRSQVEEP